MSKARIVSHIGAGQYNVELYNDLTKTNLAKTKIESAIVLNDAKIATKEAEIATAQTTLETNYALYTDAVNAYTECLQQIDPCEDLLDDYESAGEDKTELEEEIIDLNDALSYFESILPDFQDTYDTAVIAYDDCISGGGSCVTESNYVDNALFNLSSTQTTINYIEFSITGAEADLAEMLPGYNAAKTAYNEYLEGAKCQKEKEAMIKASGEYSGSLTEVSTLEQSLEGLQVYERRLDDRLVLYNDLPPEWEPIVVWCVDLSICPPIDDGVVVSLIDIYSFAKNKYEHWIKPSFNNRDIDYSDDDGVMKPSISSSATGFIYNMLMIGPQLAWSPEYRIATISSIDTDLETAVVSYWDLTDENGTNYNGNEPSSGISFDYMDSNHLAFSSGDIVIISFCFDKFSNPTIIGFYSNPKKPTPEINLSAQLYTDYGVHFDLYNFHSMEMQSLLTTHNILYRNEVNIQTINRIEENECETRLLTIAYGISNNSDTVYWQDYMQVVPSITLTPATPLGDDSKVNVFINNEFIDAFIMTNPIGGFHLIYDDLIYYKLTFLTGSLEVTKQSYNLTTGINTQILSVNYNDADLLPLPVNGELGFAARWQIDSKLYNYSLATKSNLSVNKEGNETMFTWANKDLTRTKLFKIVESDTDSSFTIELLDNRLAVPDSVLTGSIDGEYLLSGSATLVETRVTNDTERLSYSASGGGSWDQSYRRNFTIHGWSEKAVIGASYNVFTDEIVLLEYLAGTQKEYAQNIVGSGSVSWSGALVGTSDVIYSKFYAESSVVFSSLDYSGDSLYIDGKGVGETSITVDYSGNSTTTENTGSEAVLSASSSYSKDRIIGGIIKVVDLSRKMIFRKSLLREKVRASGGNSASGTSSASDDLASFTQELIIDGNIVYKDYPPESSVPVTIGIIINPTGMPLTRWPSETVCTGDNPRTCVTTTLYGDR